MPAKLQHNGLTVKETKYITHLIRTGQGADAVEEAYNVRTRANAFSMDNELRKKPRIQEAIRLEMQKQGLSPEVVVDALKQNLIAGIGVKATAETTNRAIDLYSKITGLYDREDIEQSYKLTLSKLNGRELKEELTRITKHSTALINDLG